jgi:outer membrane protein assembly factor BamB
MTPRKPLRLWPGVVCVVLLWLARFGLKAVVPGFKGFALGAQGGLIGAAAVVLWWLFFSRAAWVERLGAIVLMILGLGAAWILRHESMGPFWLAAYAIPVLCLAFVAGAVATRRLPDRSRRATMAATILLASGGWTLVRTEGITGDHVAKFAWRWTKTPEEKALAQAGDAAVVLPSNPPVPAAAKAPEALPVPAAPEKPAIWPGFRGPNRDGVIRGAAISTDWSKSPPVELWRRPIGPGWSSFAVRGDLVYTQEQRANDENVSCYNLTSGKLVWRHRDAARFAESNGGAGPRGTPAVSQRRVYALGATGILNALDADTGALVWSRNVESDTGLKVPYWGFTSSPLVVNDAVIVAASGRLAAYDVATGTPRWSLKTGGSSYSSPHPMTIGGVSQVVMLSSVGATGVALSDGTRLWDHAWGGSPIVQPAMTADGDVLIVAGAGSGTRRIAVAHGPRGWTVEERWTSIGLKPYFNDFVVHKGHAFGFDDRILACIDLKDGARKWKGGRYGNGQLVLLPEQDLLLVLSEEGELALVKATPDEFTELARFPAIEGKTWNHPVLVGDILLVRNGGEMAAFRLSRAPGPVRVE